MALINYTDISRTDSVTVDKGTAVRLVCNNRGVAGLYIILYQWIIQGISGVISNEMVRYRSDTTSHSLEIFFSTSARITLDLCRVFKPATKK